MTDLIIPTEEQSEFYDKKLFPHHNQKLCSALSRCDTNQASHHMQELAQLHYTNGIVSEIVSSELSPQEKKSLLDQLQKYTKDQSQEIIFNQPNANGYMPLQVAVMYDNYPLVQDLLYRKADPNKRDANQRPICFDAQNVEMLKLLQAFGGKPLEDRDSLGRTLLHENASCDSKDIEIATWSIANGSLVNKKNVYGQTACQEQAMRGGENRDLSKEEWANEMTRENLGINPHMLRALQTGQFRLKRS